MTPRQAATMQGMAAFHYHQHSYIEAHTLSSILYAVRISHLLKVLDVQHLDPGVNCQGGNDLLHDSAICIGGHVLLEP